MRSREGGLEKVLEGDRMRRINTAGSQQTAIITVYSSYMHSHHHHGWSWWEGWNLHVAALSTITSTEYIQQC